MAAATAIQTTKIAEAAVIMVAEFIVAVPSSEAELSYDVALLSEAEPDTEEPTLLTIAAAGGAANPLTARSAARASGKMPDAPARELS
jgi:hypothetical protein